MKLDGNTKNGRNILQTELDLDILCRGDGIKLNSRKYMIIQVVLAVTWKRLWMTSNLYEEFMEKEKLSLIHVREVFAIGTKDLCCWRGRGPGESAWHNLLSPGKTLMCLFRKD